MSQLATLQAQFQAHLLASQPDILHEIVSTEKLSNEFRLSIYSNAYSARLMEALSDNYPVLHQYLGDALFEKLAEDYIDQYPSTFRSIRWFGDQFENFIKTVPELVESPFLMEFAKVEWIMTLVFDASDHSTVTHLEMAAIAPDIWHTLRFVLHPSVYLLNLQWNIVPLWRAIMEETDLPQVEQTVEATTWLFWRQERMTRFCSLPVTEASALIALQQGANFGEICEVLNQWIAEEEVAVYAVSLLKGWLSAGLIAAIQFD